MNPSVSENRERGEEADGDHTYLRGTYRTVSTTSHSTVRAQRMIYPPAPLDTVALVFPTKRWHHMGGGNAF